jgi:4'-phosphopantetheinyl transferase
LNPLVVEVWRADVAMSGADARARAAVADAQLTNVSHTTGLTVLAVAPVRVGIDVEVVRDRRYLDALARRSMTDAEFAEWHAAADPVRAFVQHWTRVEAYLKAVGTGVRGGLRTRPPDGWTVVDLDVGAAHAGALAVEAGERAVTVRGRDLHPSGLS